MSNSWHESQTYKPYYNKEILVDHLIFTAKLEYRANQEMDLVERHINDKLKLGNENKMKISNGWCR